MIQCDRTSAKSAETKRDVWSFLTGQGAVLVHLQSGQPPHRNSFDRASAERGAHAGIGGNCFSCGTLDKATRGAPTLQKCNASYLAVMGGETEGGDV